MRRFALIMFSCFIVYFISLSTAFGAEITSSSDPALSGGTVIDFEAQTIGTYNSPFTIDNVEFSGNGTMYIENTYGGQFNTNGQYLASQGNSGEGYSFTFRFSTPLSAFGFNWGASDYTWTLTAYDSNDNQLDSMQVPPTHGSNAGDFFGLSANSIAYATIAFTSPSDYVMIDNFTYQIGSSITPTSIPTMNEWGMILMSLILAASAIWIIRKSQTV